MAGIAEKLSDGKVKSDQIGFDVEVRRRKVSGRIRSLIQNRFDREKAVPARFIANLLVLSRNGILYNPFINAKSIAIVQRSLEIFLPFHYVLALMLLSSTQISVLTPFHEEHHHQLEDHKVRHSRSQLSLFRISDSFDSPQSPKGMNVKTNSYVLVPVAYPRVQVQSMSFKFCITLREQ
jgi:hypothetical protein